MLGMPSSRPSEKDALCPPAREYRFRLELDFTKASWRTQFVEWAQYFDENAASGLTELIDFIAAVHSSELEHRLR